MKLFWKLNFYLSLIVIVLFFMYIISIKFCLINYTVSGIIAKLTFMFFIYGAFLEIIQIPICAIGLFFGYKPKRVLLFFLMMTIFFIIKISLYVYILGAGL